MEHSDTFKVNCFYFIKEFVAMDEIIVTWVLSQTLFQNPLSSNHIAYTIMQDASLFFVSCRGSGSWLKKVKRGM